MGGGNLEPKILLEMKDKEMIPYNTPEDGVAPTITTMYARLGTNNLTPGEYGGAMGIMEIKSCASRKRGDELKIETRKDEPANCVTSIDADSMVQEFKPSKQEKGILVYDDYNGNFPKDQNICGTVTTMFGRDSIRHGFKIFERFEPQVLTPLRTEEGRQLRKQGIEKFSNRALYPREDGVSNTITSVQKDNLLQEPKIVGYSRDEKGKIVGHHLKDVANTIHTGTGSGRNTDQYVAEGIEYKGKFIKEGDGLYTNVSKDFIRGGLEGVSRTLKAEKHDAATCVKEGARYRIRKLTEREVFRLMDVSEEDIDKIQAACISKTAQYKLAGNSIVCSCLYHIFRKLFCEPQCEDQQLSLFDFDD